MRWWRSETLIDSADMSTGFPNVKNNQLVIGPLDRSHLHAVFTCTASNNNISQPVSARVTLEMHRKCKMIYPTIYVMIFFLNLFSCFHILIKIFVLLIYTGLDIFCYITLRS